MFVYVAWLPVPEPKLQWEALESKALSLDRSLPRSVSLPLEAAGKVDGVQSEIAFRGLAVRMVVSTGTAEKVTLHGISRRVEYEGQVILSANQNVLQHGSDCQGSGSLAV